MKRVIKFERGNYYHIYNRGANRASIFKEEDNYLYVLEKLKHYSKNYDITVLAYVLLPNHYHFLLRQNGFHPARLVPQYTFNAYTKAFNKRYDHSGTLFEGPYRALEVYSTPNILNICRYIHANPVLHGFVDEPAAWQFSNYLEWIDQRQGTLIDRHFVSSHFDSCAAYERFVMKYIRTLQLPRPLAEYLSELDSP